ncbi:MAG: hypothetical protein LC803_14655 [Acidobacteria bacterium]|nr:hypothetical protein [Acidobacteriota bacterium]
MITSSRRRSLAVLLALVVISASTSITFANHAWNNYHWARQSNPFTLKLGDNLTATDWKSYLRTTSSDWNAGKTPVQTTVVAGTSNRRCAMVSGTTQVCNDKYGYNGWLGLASINISGSHITQGSAKLNDSYFTSATYNNPSEKLHVMCQEVAHTFGLGHTSEDGSSQNTCMDYYQNKTDDGISTKPNQHDFDMLNSIYAHLDSITTVSTTSAATAGRSDVTEDPNSWGSLMSQSRNGRSSTYQRANADGTHTITHVFWTEEAAARGAMHDHRYDH